MAIFSALAAGALLGLEISGAVYSLPYTPANDPRWVKIFFLLFFQKIFKISIKVFVFKAFTFVDKTDCSLGNLLKTKVIKEIFSNCFGDLCLSSTRVE